MKTHILKAAVFAMAVLSVSSFGQTWYYDNTTYPPYQFIAPNYPGYPVMCPWSWDGVSVTGTLFLGDAFHYVRAVEGDLKIGVTQFCEYNHKNEPIMINGGDGGVIFPYSVGIGTTNRRATVDIAHAPQQGDSGTIVNISTYIPDDYGSFQYSNRLCLKRSRGSSVDSLQTTNNNDILGCIVFNGVDAETPNPTWDMSGLIKFEQAGDAPIGPFAAIPGRMTFIVGKLDGGWPNNAPNMVIEPYGTVGIGTSSPSSSYLLDVAGSARASGNAIVNGNVGIGITNPTDKLAVDGDISLGNSANAFIKMNMQSGGNSMLYFQGAGTSSHYVSVFGGSPTSMGVLCALYGGGWTSNNIQMFHNGTSGQIATGSGNLILTPAGGNTTINGNASVTGSATVGSLSSSGNVGIGITNPATKLQIDNGTVSITNTWGKLGIGLTNPGSMMQVTSNAAIGYPASQAAPANGLVISGPTSIGVATTNPGTHTQLLVSDGAAIGYTASQAAPASGLVVSGSVGIGTTAPGSNLQVQGSFGLKVTTQTGAYTVAANDAVIVVNNGSTAVTITLPTATSAMLGRTYYIKRLGTGVVTVKAPSSDYIDGTVGTTGKQLTTQYATLQLVCGGISNSAWYIISNY